MKARAMIALIALFVAVVAPGMPNLSTAAFTSISTNTGTVRAAVDWTPPTVGMVGPDSPIRGVVTVISGASDSESGIADVTIQYAAPGGAWISLCTTTVTPYSCSWDTRALGDGAYTLRVIATDNAGYTAISDAVSATVENSSAVALSHPGEVVRGPVDLTASLVNAGKARSAVRVEYAVGGTDQWQTLCSNVVASYDCTWHTPSFTNGYYDLRATAAANASVTYSAIISDVLVDNAAPSVTLEDPGSHLGADVEVLRGERTSTAPTAETGVLDREF